MRFGVVVSNLLRIVRGLKESPGATRKQLAEGVQLCESEPQGVA